MGNKNVAEVKCGMMEDFVLLELMKLRLHVEKDTKSAVLYPYACKMRA